MIIVLYGPDSYRRIQKLNEIVEAFRKKQSNLSHERFDLSDEEDFFKFQHFAVNRSIFNSVRLAILDGFDSFGFAQSRPESNRTGDRLTTSNIGVKELKAILKTHFEDKNLVILISSDKKPPATFSALLKSPSQVQDFPSLKDAEVNTFIKKTAKELGIVVDAAATRALIQTFGSNSWGIATELEKMALSNDEAKAPLSIHRPADNFFAGLDLGDSTDIDSDRRIKFQSLTSGCCFGVAEHNPYLMPYLIYENQNGF